MTREQIEERMNELARKYLEAHDPEIPYELYKLARELEKIQKESSTKKSNSSTVVNPADIPSSMTREEIDK
jgi:hypothetical protein